MYNDSQLNITTQVPLSDRGGGGCSFSFSSSPPTETAPTLSKEKRFRKGDVNPPDGTIFWCYSAGMSRKKELWLTPEQYAKKQERHRAANRKYEATVDRKKRNAHAKLWAQTARGKALIARSKNKPENRAKARERDRIRRIKYNQRAEVVAAKESRRRQQEEARRLRATPEYQAALRKRQNERQRELYKKRYGNDPQYTVAMRVRSRIYQALKAGGYSKPDKTDNLVGCSFSFLRQHIERQFKGKMSWDNPNSYHIDHIVPLTAFDLTDPTQLKVACNWQNMRPLSPRKNMSKGAKLLHPQQQLPLSVHSTTFNTQAA
jgi:hypothetical protein